MEGVAISEGYSFCQRTWSFIKGRCQPTGEVDVRSGIMMSSPRQALNPLISVACYTSGDLEPPTRL